MLLSIITVCFNDLKGLLITADSVLNQTYGNFEWIIIDGGSNDGTKEWLLKLNDPKIKWISEPDKGIFDGMNKGLRIASGDFFIFMNSFDEFENPRTVEFVVSAIQNANIKPGLVYGNSIDVSELNEHLYKKARSHRKNWMGMFASHQSMFFEKNNSIVFRSDFPITADYAFISEYLKILSRDKILYIDLPVCRFKLGGTNEKLRYKALKEDYRIRREIIKLSIPISGIMYLLHFGHTIIKRRVPSVAKKIRYSK